MLRTRAKICGITRTEDALKAIEFGCDALGFVFYPPSPRFVESAVVGEITSQLPPFVSVVGLFVNAEPDLVRQTIKEAGLTCLQFHGDEPPEYCEQFRLPWFKAIRVKDDTDLYHEAKRYDKASALLLDTYKKGVPGGTGEKFNWSLIPDDLGVPVILAGGLDASNVASAIRQVNPYAVDVSGGVEAQKAVKSNEKMIAFMNEVLK
ncbi:phosphoribosylanthranilate isomerase [Litoribacillus peritrichatus]|uniref:N-(5'-phosphoribosyl)anthranilate isomerase n=1 Tax=Litoribacillus peritrichatus TaxID=718191 RepID=A0ABP7LZ11_9GAMM